MKNLNNIIAVLSALIMSVFTVNAQCDLSNTGIGNFDGSNYDQWTKFGTQSDVKYGTYSKESSKKHSGSHSLKANVTKDNTWQMRILTKCNYPLANGTEYTITAWLKGQVGDKVKVVLQQNNNGTVELGTSTIEISSSDWKKYTVKHTSNGNYSKGKIKFVFQDKGVYYLDDVTVSADESIVSPPASGSSWYVKGGKGKDNTNGGNGKSPSKPLNSLGYAVKTAWKPGDIIYVMEGTYRNSNYGKVQSSGGKSGYNNPAFLTIKRKDINTSKDNWLIITNYPGDKPKIQFDGESGIVLRDGVSYVDISGLEIEGANQKITKKQAIANRTVQNKYFGGQGIAVWGGSRNPHHIKIHHMKVHDCGGSGIRVNDGDYIDLSYNEVYNCNWYTWLGSSAIVIAQSKDFDKLDKIKMLLTHNIVHDNRNFVPFYCCEVSPTGGDYGTIKQNYIHDGSGVYITRNNPGTPWQSKTDYLHGWFYFANNITYNNGINGLVVHKTDRTIVTNNIAYMNGTVDPRPVSKGGDGRQAAGGITINASKKVFMYNNISQVRSSSDFNYRTFGKVSYTASNNIGINGKSNFKAGSEFTKLTPTSNDANNLFVNPSKGDFHPKASSIAIDAGKNHSDLPPFDYDGNPRNGAPDIGAYEYTTGTSSGTNSGGSKISGTFYFKNRASGLYMDSEGDSNKSIKVNGKHKWADQHWKVVEVSNGNYNIIGVHGDRGCLDSQGGGQVIWSSVQSSSSKDRLWKLEDAGDGYYRFKNQFSNRGYLAKAHNSNKIEYTDWNGNRAQWKLEKVSSAKELLPEVATNTVKIYPNPAISFFTIDTGNDAKSTIKVFNISGQMVLERVVSNVTTIQTDALGSGIYFVRVFNEDGSDFYTEKLILK